jgi:hypothetical protein
MATNSNSWTPLDGISNYNNVSATPQLADNQDATTAVAAPTAASPTGLTSAITRTVDDKELLSKQVNNVIGADSPLMQQAAAKAKQAANSRGLLNSSMAVQAGQAAVMDRALPIAQYDAGVNTNVLATNQANEQQSNTFNASQTQQNSQFNTNKEQELNKFNAQNQNQTNQFNAAEQNKTNIFNANEQNVVIKQFMDQSNKLQLADIEASYKTILQSEAAAGSLYQQSVRNISDILQNPDLTPEAKTAAVTNQNEMLKTGLNILGKIGGLNFDGLLDF